MFAEVATSVTVIYVLKMPSEKGSCDEVDIEQHKLNCDSKTVNI